MLENALKIIEYIKNSVKRTPVKLYVNGTNLPVCEGCQCFGTSESKVLIGESAIIKAYLKDNENAISESYMENDRRNSGVPLMDITEVNARIEPGVWIRENVVIGDNAVIMMGAVINIGAVVGDETMIDMNAVLGGRVKVGKRCHIGAGAVLAGVIEPPSATPVVIEDGVAIGANAVVLEGVRVGAGAVVGAGSVVTKDVPPNAVVVGNPARIMKEEKDDGTIEKTKIVDDLRKI